MRDIYHAIISRDFRQDSDEVLEEDLKNYGDAAMATGGAMRVIGNLLIEVDLDGQGYSDKEARRDLFLTGLLLRHFPRMIAALEQNQRQVSFELKNRKEAKGGAKS